jgi:hypothetical protein
MFGNHVFGSEWEPKPKQRERDLAIGSSFAKMEEAGVFLVHNGSPSSS